MQIADAFCCAEHYRFISKQHWFNVSSPTLDGVFGPFSAPDAIAKSSRVGKLY